MFTHTFVCTYDYRQSRGGTLHCLMFDSTSDRNKTVIVSLARRRRKIESFVHGDCQSRVLDFGFTHNFVRSTLYVFFGRDTQSL